MTKIMGSRVWLLGLVVALLSPLLQADYRNHPEAAEFVATMVEKHDFDRAWVVGVLEQAEHKQSIIDAMNRPAESVMTWGRYRKIFIQDSRIEQGVKFWHENRATLERAEAKYGVPAEMIVGIIGVETRYGRNTGSYRVVDALATLGFDFPKRGKFFRGQLEQYLILVREQKFQPFDLKGSYAGAMGYGQFIPSSYRAYAVDFDGDGVANIVSNVDDAIGSVANYFSKHGWRSGEAVVSAARLSKTADHSVFNTGLKPVKTLADFAQAGVTATKPLPLTMPATAMKFDGARGDEYWLGLKNFYVITRYNHSAMYAMAAHQLSRKIARKMNEQALASES